MFCYDQKNFSTNYILLAFIGLYFIGLPRISAWMERHGVESWFMHIHPFISTATDSGSIYSVAPGAVVTKVLTDVGKPQAIAFSKFCSTFYFVDSDKSILMGYDFNLHDGTICKSQSCIHVSHNTFIFYEQYVTNNWKYSASRVLSTLSGRTSFCWSRSHPRFGHLRLQSE